MPEFITIKTKDEWGRLSKMQFCVEDLVKVGNLIIPVAERDMLNNDSAKSSI